MQSSSPCKHTEMKDKATHSHLHVTEVNSLKDKANQWAYQTADITT